MKEITMLPIVRIHPHPDNPRKDLGDLTELAESIRENGIFQNLTVVDDDPTEYFSDYTVIIGHRRLAAAKLAGLTEVPCAIVEMTPAEQVETMLVENMQRSDLTPIEQAQGFQMVMDLGVPLDEIAEKSGFSRKTIRDRMEWTKLNQEKLKEVSARQISIGDLNALSKLDDIDARNEVLDTVGTADFDFTLKRALQKQDAARNLPKVKAWLKNAKGKKIDSSSSWNRNKYEPLGNWISIAKWGEDGNKPPQEIPDPLFYTLDDNTVRLYRQAERAEPQRRTPEEIARDKAIAAAWKQLEEASGIAFELRRSFVEGLSVTGKNKADIIQGAFREAIFETVSFNTPDRPALIALLELDPHVYGDERSARLFENLGKVKDRDLAKIVYALWGDGAGLLCVEPGSRRDFPRFEVNNKLRFIYDWLQMLGYEKSTEEQALLYGEHEAYRSEEAFKDGQTE